MVHTISVAWNASLQTWPDMANADVAIRVENLSKRYRIGLKEEIHDTLVGAVLDLFTRPVRNLRRLRRLSTFNGNGHDLEDIIWALKDVSFDVKQGEVLGIIGRNGAGKSTLLKIVSRITEPTKGRVEIHGRVASLLEVGTGFHPELTGRENVYLNGAVLGMTRAEIERKFDEIVDFAGVERFIDTPVKRYSSGMQVRLGFAVAAHLEPEILLVDEVLAVGDAEFQKKCLGKMERVARGGRTVLFVSHNMNAIQTLCSRVIWLDSGTIIGQGEVLEQVESYLNSNREGMELDPNAPIYLGPDLQLRKFDFIPNPVQSKAPLEFIIELCSARRVRFYELAVLIYTSLGVRVAVLDLRRPGIVYRLDGTTTLTIRGEVASLPLVEGEYYIGLDVRTDEMNENILDLHELRVLPLATQGGIVPYPRAARGVLDLEFALSD